MEYISYCGLLCYECPIFIATKNNDLEAKKQLAIDCSSEDNTFTADDMTCKGCFWNKNDTTKMCGDCETRNCAKSKSVNNCGLCRDYPCDIVERRIPKGSENRIRLDNIKSNQAKYENISLFEFGSVFSDLPGAINKTSDKKVNLPWQKKHLSLIEAGNTGEAYDKVKGKLEYLLENFYLKAYFENSELIPEWADKGTYAKIKVSEKEIGYVSAVDREVLNSLGIKKETAIAEVDFEKLTAAIRELSPGYRTVFNMYAVEGYSHQEIGTKLGISELLSRTTLYRARNILKEKLSQLTSNEQYYLAG